MGAGAGAAAIGMGAGTRAAYMLFCAYYGAYRAEKAQNFVSLHKNKQTTVRKPERPGRDSGVGVFVHKS